MTCPFEVLSPPTAQLASEFGITDDILTHPLDGLIEQFRSLEAGPFESYQKARALVRPGISRIEPPTAPISPTTPNTPPH